MKKIFLLASILILSSFSLAAEEVNIRFLQKEVKQGRIEKVEFYLKENGHLANDLQKLRGQKIGTTFYIQSIGAALKKDGQNEYVADGKLVVISVPKESEIKQDIAGNSIVFKWTPIEVQKVEVPKSFISADFAVPTRTNFLGWFILVLLIGVGIKVVLVLKKRSHLKAMEKRRKQEINDLVFKVVSYEDVVGLWKKKSTVLAVYPHLEDPFKDLEEVLFKYQFKLTQTEKEKELTIAAYKEFSNKAKGVIGGV